MPAPAAGAAAAAAGGGGCGGALAGTGALAPAPGALSASRPRAAAPPGPRSHSRSPAERRPSLFPTRGGLAETPGLQPFGEEFAHLPAPSRPSRSAAALCPRRHPRRSSWPRASSKVSEERLQRGCSYTLDTGHLSRLSATRGKRSASPDSEPTWRGREILRFEKLFFGTHPHSGAPRGMLGRLSPPLLSGPTRLHGYLERAFG